MDIVEFLNICISSFHLQMLVSYACNDFERGEKVKNLQINQKSCYIIFDLNLNYWVHGSCKEVIKQYS